FSVSSVPPPARSPLFPYTTLFRSVYEDIKTSIHQKASATMAQKATGSFAKAIQRRTEEFSWALDQLEQERFMTIIPSLVVFGDTDRKSTRLNSSHVKISYAVFCLK